MPDSVPLLQEAAPTPVASQGHRFAAGRQWALAQSDAIVFGEHAYAGQRTHEGLKRWRVRLRHRRQVLAPFRPVAKQIRRAEGRSDVVGP